MDGQQQTSDPSPKLRVLIVHDSISENGGVRMTIDLANNFVRAGVPTELFGLQPVREGRSASVPSHVPVRQGVPDGARLRTHGPRALVRLVEASRWSDVVVSGSELGLGLLSGYAASRVARRPYAVIAHAPLGPALERWVPAALHRPTRSAHRHAEAVFCVSRDVLRGELENGRPPQATHLVTNGIDIERVRHLASSPAPKRRRALVGLGRLSAEKGFDLLIRAHEVVRSSGIDHELELVGDGPEREALWRLAASLGVEDSVAFVGFEENPFPRLAGAEALVVPSRLEGFSLSVLEALALGVPVIANRSAPGVSEVLGDETGLLVESDSIDVLAAALRRHLESPAFLRARAAAGVAIAERHDAARTSAAYLSVLRGVVRERTESSRQFRTSCP